MKSDIIAATKHRHWAERQYLKYPTIVNKQQINKTVNCMVQIMQKAKSTFYLSEINSATSKKSLFAICNKLLGLEKLVPFPNIYIIFHLPAIFSDLFINKVTLIRTSIDQHKLHTQKSTTQTSLTIFDSFRPVTITQLHTMIKKSKKAPSRPPVLWIPYQLIFCLNVLMTICQRSPISLTLQYCLANF